LSIIYQHTPMLSHRLSRSDSKLLLAAAVAVVAMPLVIVVGIPNLFNGGLTGFKQVTCNVPISVDSTLLRAVDLVQVVPGRLVTVCHNDGNPINSATFVMQPTAATSSNLSIGGSRVVNYSGMIPTGASFPVSIDITGKQVGTFPAAFSPYSDGIKINWD